jgi:hypothetical protein
VGQNPEGELKDGGRSNPAVRAGQSLGRSASAPYISRPRCVRVRVCEDRRLRRQLQIGVGNVAAVECRRRTKSSIARQTTIRSRGAREDRSPLARPQTRGVVTVGRRWCPGSRTADARGSREHHDDPALHERSGELTRGIDATRARAPRRPNREGESRKRAGGLKMRSRRSRLSPVCHLTPFGRPPVLEIFKIVREFGGEGQNRTGDTTIFSRMLYQLSYLAPAGAQDHSCSRVRRARHRAPQSRQRPLLFSRTTSSTLSGLWPRALAWFTNPGVMPWSRSRTICCSVRSLKPSSFMSAM